MKTLKKSNPGKEKKNFVPDSKNEIQIYNLIILDESGSMQSIKSSIISGFNEVIQSIKNTEKKYAEQKHFVTFVSFNSTGIKTHLEDQPAGKIKKIKEKSYRPNSLTPLFDTVGSNLNKLSYKLAEKKDLKVFVTILTDGLENASREYTGKMIRELIEELKSLGWEFTYIGTEHDIDKTAESIGINNAFAFDKNKGSINCMFSEQISSKEILFKKLHKEFNEKSKI